MDVIILISRLPVYGKQLLSLFVFRNRKGTKNYGRFAGKEMTFPAKFLQFSTRGKLCCNVNKHRGGQINVHITVLVSSLDLSAF